MGLQGPTVTFPLGIIEKQPTEAPSIFLKMVCLIVLKV